MEHHADALRGVLHGKIIELEREPGLPDGQQVQVTLQPVREKGQRSAAGAGIRQSAGAWADDADELDGFLEWNRQQRKLDRRAGER